MVAGFLRVLTSGVLFLATTTTFVQRGGAYSSVTSDSTAAPATSDSTAAPVTSDGTAAPATSDATDATTAPATGDDDVDSCATEAVACLADATCLSCDGGASDTTADNECGEYNLFTSTSEGCDVNLDTVCCLDDASEFECLDNAAFEVFWMCRVNDFGCGVDEITCDGDESTTACNGVTIVGIIEDNRIIP